MGFWPLRDGRECALHGHALCHLSHYRFSLAQAQIEGCVLHADSHECALQSRVLCHVRERQDSNVRQGGREQDEQLLLFRLLAGPALTIRISHQRPCDSL